MQGCHGQRHCEITDLGLLTLAIGSKECESRLIKMTNWFTGLQEGNGSWINKDFVDPNLPAVHRAEVNA
jgi:hypothetical protein